MLISGIFSPEGDFDPVFPAAVIPSARGGYGSPDNAFGAAPPENPAEPSAIFRSWMDNWIRVEGGLRAGIFPCLETPRYSRPGSKRIPGRNGAIPGWKTALCPHYPTAAPLEFWWPLSRCHFWEGTSFFLLCLIPYFKASLRSCGISWIFFGSVRIL